MRNPGIIRGFLGEKVMEDNPIDIERLKLTIVYDNYAYDRRLQADHGFSCLIEGLDKTLLFDTGGNGSIVMDNLKRLNIAPDQVDVVFISHGHYDHNGGLHRFLEAHPNVEIYVPESASASYRAIAGQFGSTVIPVDKPKWVCRGAISTGQMQSPIIAEQSLSIPTNKGAVVVTGCAHPGICNIVDRAGELTRQTVFMALGGFHLVSDTVESVRKTISRLQTMGVRYVAPSHCTGKEAIGSFADAFKKTFVQSGVGRVVQGAELSG